MKQLKFILVVTLLLWTFGPEHPLWASQKLKKEDALALLKRSHDVMDIRAEGSTPFRLDAELKIFGMAAGTVKGKYSMVWASPDRWREEISFPGFSQVSVGGKDKVWIYRNLNFRPLRVFQLDEALHGAKKSALKAGEKVKSVRRRQQDGKVTDCVRVGAQHAGRTLCFDSATGALLGESGGRYSFRFEDYAPLGSKLYPQKIEVREDDRLALDIEITGQALVEQPDRSLFTPPRGAVEWKSCANPTDPVPLSTPEPAYPFGARQWRQGGVELSYILVDENGDVSHAAILDSIGPDFDKVTIDTEQGSWKFVPANCHGTAVPAEALVETTFRMYD